MKLTLVTLIFSISVLSAQRDWSKIEISSQELAAHLYMLEGSGGNMALFSGDDATLLIDDQFAPLSEKIMEKVEDLTGAKVTHLVNTHWHGDHTGGNENFGNAGALIIAHDNVRKRLSTDQLRPFGRTTKASAEVAWPKMTFNEEMQLHINGETVQLIHIHNAHTDGDAFVYFVNANVLHMGDCFFKDRFPYVDTAMGGTAEGAIKAVEVALMLTNDETKIVPGHGGLANREDLLRYQEMWHIMRDRIKQAITDGVNEESLDYSTLTKDYEEWGNGFINAEKMVKMLFGQYNSQK